MGSGDHRTNVRGGGRSGNDDATGAALHSVESGWVQCCGVVRNKLWMWPVILRHRGRGHGRSPDHRPLGGCSSPRGWGEAHKSDETASSMELIYRSMDDIKSAIRLPRKWTKSFARCEAWVRPKRGARGRTATPCTATLGGASGLSTVDSDLENPAHGWRVGPASRKSNVVARCGQPTAVNRYRRCAPARPACRAGPTQPA